MVLYRRRRVALRWRWVVTTGRFRRRRQSSEQKTLLPCLTGNMPTRTTRGVCEGSRECVRRRKRKCSEKMAPLGVKRMDKKRRKNGNSKASYEGKTRYSSIFPRKEDRRIYSGSGPAVAFCSQTGTRGQSYNNNNNIAQASKISVVVL